MSTHCSAVLLTQIKCGSGSREKWFQAFQGQRDRTPTNTDEFHHQGENGVGGQCWGVVTKLRVDITLCQHNDVCPMSNSPPREKKGKKKDKESHLDRVSF